jgi:hypothetical protein
MFSLPYRDAMRRGKHPFSFPLSQNPGNGFSGDFEHFIGSAYCKMSINTIQMQKMNVIAHKKTI